MVEKNSPDIVAEPQAKLKSFIQGSESFCEYSPTELFFCKYHIFYCSIFIFSKFIQLFF